jgi:hypothetical protein
MVTRRTASRPIRRMASRYGQYCKSQSMCPGVYRPRPLQA